MCRRPEKDAQKDASNDKEERGWGTALLLNCCGSIVEWGGRWHRSSDVLIDYYPYPHGGLIR